MKRMSFIILCTLFCVSNIMGEEEIEFTVWGYPTIVVWPQGTVNADCPSFWYTTFHTGEGDIFNLTNKIDGDSIVDGKTYGRMMFYYETKDDLLTGAGLCEWGQPYGKSEYADTLLYRQEEDRVFCIPKGEREERLIVDYGLEVGDEFVNSAGEKFLVTGAGTLKNGANGNWTTINCCQVRSFFFYAEPKVLELVSMNTGERETWVEGIGSLNWGVVPMYIAEGIRPFSQLNRHPQRAQVCMATPENMSVMPNVNEEDYKAMLITQWKHAHDEDLGIEYFFEGDTLCVNGIQNSRTQFTIPYAECLVTGNRIDFMLKHSSASPTIKINFSVRIPGFRSGIYQVGMPGQEYVTLECSGTDGIETMKNEKMRDPDILYDLAGRRTVHPTKGMYIRQGRKVVK